MCAGDDVYYGVCGGRELPWVLRFKVNLLSIIIFIIKDGDIVSFAGDDDGKVSLIVHVAVVIVAS